MNKETNRANSPTTHTITPRLPLEEAAEGYRAMDERRAIKTLLRP
jgi:threonine dehydrogenase-like Zn-dependent dehydrogenase